MLNAKKCNNEVRDKEQVMAILNKDNFSIKNIEVQFLDLLAVHNNQETILNLLQNKLKYDETKEKAFNRLYDELDAIKYDKEFQKVKPLYLDLILLYDRIDSLKSENNNFDTVQDELLEILAKQNIDIIETKSDIFDLSLQKVVDTQIVRKKESDSKVVKVVRNGFMCEDKILRAQEVVIGKYIKSEK